MKNKIVLIHGYNKSSKDMLTLKNNLVKMDYEVNLIDLPLTYKRVDDCLKLFCEQIDKILSESNDSDTISLVGHSAGGLIVRFFLQRTTHLTRIGRCVLVATPNKGSKLADLVIKLFKPAGKIFKTLEDLTTINSSIGRLPDKQVGAIAGNNSKLLLGKLLKSENDGRVEVDSVIIEGLKDFAVLPYGHKEIHYKYETAKLINNFIRYGTFGKSFVRI